jgi:hypothetical protein
LEEEFKGELQRSIWGQKASVNFGSSSPDFILFDDVNDRRCSHEKYHNAVMHHAPTGRFAGTAVYC